MLSTGSRSPLSWPALMLFPAGGVYLIWLIASRAGRWPHLYEWAVIVLCIGFYPLTAAFSVYMAGRKNKTAQEPQTWQLDATGISVSGLTYASKLAWPAIHRVVETKRFFFFYVSGLMAYCVPLRVLAEHGQVQELRTLVRQALPGRVRLRDRAEPSPG